MQNELLVDRSSLSKTIREKISIYDDTPSSASLGVLAIVFMAVMMVFIIANDAIRVTQFLMGVIRGPGTRIGNHGKIDG
nr:hypothetical protein BaRGS_015240 [Batillaria attramentaria]